MATPNPFDAIFGIEEPDDGFTDPDYPIKEPEQPAPEPEPEVNPFDAMFGIEPPEPEPMPEPVEELGTVENLWAGLKERGMELLSNLPGGIQTYGQALEGVDEESWLPSLGGFVHQGGLDWDYFSPEEWKQYSQDGGKMLLTDMQEDWGNVSYGFTPHAGQNWEILKGDAGLWEKAQAAGAFALETGVISLADMAGAVVAPPAYIMSRAEEIAQERAVQAGRPGRPNNDDLQIALGAAVLIQGMERFGFDRIADAWTKGGPALQRILTAGVSEAATEAIQEPLEYGAETYGTPTEEAMTTGEYALAMGERSAQGALGGGPVGAVLATPGALMKEPTISPDVKSTDENRNAISRELNEQAVRMEEQGVIRDERALLEEEEQAEMARVSRLTDELDAQEQTYRTAAHAEAKLQQLEKKHGETGLEMAQDVQTGEWFLSHRGRASMHRVAAERAERLGVGLRPAEEGQMDVEQIGEIATEPAPTTEGIEVTEGAEQITMQEPEGIEVTPGPFDEEITMQGGTVETGLEPVAQPIDWEPQTRGEAEEVAQGKTYRNALRARMALNKLKEEHAGTKLRAVKVREGEWRLLPPSMADAYEIQQRSDQLGPGRPTEAPIEVTEIQPTEVGQPAPTTEGIEVSELQAEEIGEAIPQPAVEEITEEEAGIERIEAPRKIFPGREEGGRTRGEINTELAQVQEELDQQPRRVDLEEETDTFEKIQGLLRRRQQLTDELDTGLSGEQLQNQRNFVRDLAWKLGINLDKFATLAEMEKKIGMTPEEAQTEIDARQEAADAEALERIRAREGEPEMDKSEITGRDVPVTYMDEVGYTDYIAAAEARGQVLIHGIGQVEVPGEAIIRKREPEPDTTEVVDDEIGDEPTQEQPIELKTSDGYSFFALEDGRVVDDPDNPDMIFDSMEEFLDEQGEMPLPAGWNELAKRRSEAFLKKWAGFMAEEGPETPTPTSTDVLPDGTEYDLSHTKDTQVPNTVGTYDKVMEEYFGDVDNADILDYGAGMGIAARKHGFESLEPYPTGWEPDYMQADEIDRQYDGIIMNNVLNVLPKHTRHVVLADAAKRKLAPGGRMYINVRSRGDVMSQKDTAKKVYSESEILTQRDTYQKGFTRSELIKYLERELGDGYTVESAKFGSVAVMVTKKRVVKLKGKAEPKKPPRPAWANAASKPAHISQAVWDARDNPELLKDLQKLEAELRDKWSMDELQAYARANDYLRIGNRSAIAEEALLRFAEDGTRPEKLPLTTWKGHEARYTGKKIKRALGGKQDQAYEVVLLEGPQKGEHAFVDEAPGEKRILSMVHVLRAHHMDASREWAPVKTIGDIEIVQAISGESEGKYGYHVLGSDRLFGGSFADMKSVEKAVNRPDKQTKRELDQARNEIDIGVEPLPGEFRLYDDLPEPELAFGREFTDKTKQHPLMDDARILMNPAQNDPEDFAIIEIEPFAKKGGILVKTIQSSRTRRGNGNAAISFLLDLANEYQVELMLDAQAYGELQNRLSQKQLEGWYKRKGFTPMVDYEGFMIYRPYKAMKKAPTMIQRNPLAKPDWPWVAVDHAQRQTWATGATQEEAAAEAVETMASKHEGVELPEVLDYIQVPPETDLDMFGYDGDDPLYELAVSKDQKMPESKQDKKKRKAVDEVLEKVSPMERKGNRLYYRGKPISKFEVLSMIEREYSSYPGEHLIGYEDTMNVSDVLDMFNRRFFGAMEPTQTEPTDNEAQEVMDEFIKKNPAFRGSVLSHKPGDDRHGKISTHYYGEILMTKSKDGMPLDVILNQEHTIDKESKIYIVNQKSKKGKFKQHKVMAGFKDIQDAADGFREQYSDEQFMNIERITPEAFEEWKVSRDTQVAYDRQQWLGRMNKGKDLSQPVTGDNIIDPAEAAKMSDNAITDISPWLLSSGQLVETGSDHLGYTIERGLTGRPKSAAPVHEFQKKANAVRAAFFGDTGEAATFAWLHLHETQKLTKEQIAYLADFFRESRKIGKRPEILIGRSNDGDNPETERIRSIAALERWNRGEEVKEPTPEYGDTPDDLLHDAGRGDLSWGPAPEPPPMPAEEGPPVPVPPKGEPSPDAQWEPVPEPEMPPLVDINFALDRSAEGEGRNLSDIVVTATDGDRSVSHNARWWKTAIDDRLMKLNKVRGCA